MMSENSRKQSLFMPDFKAARTNMVDCQIYTAGVISPAILTAFETIPREKFVPANMQSGLHNDETISVGSGRCLLDPMTHAKMVQAVEPKPGDKILDIGGATVTPRPFFHPWQKTCWHSKKTLNL